MEWKLFEGRSHVSTAEFHADRETAPHLEQVFHQERLKTAAELATKACRAYHIATVVDLGCGDGGLLSLLPDDLTSWGYDFQPSNVASAPRRGVDVRYANFLEDDIAYGELALCTECIEHLEDPHGFLERLSHNVRLLVCSSPMNETDEWHDTLHAWAWDVEGYRAMLDSAGFDVLETREVWPFQVHVAAARR